MTEQIQPAAAPAVTKEPTTLEEVKAVMEEHGTEPVPKPEKPQAHAPAAESAKAEEKPAAESAPKPDAVPNPAAVAPKGYVPAQALREERAENKRRFDAVNKLVEEMTAQRIASAPKSSATVEPDRKTDPDGWFAWKIEQQDRELAENRKFREQTSQRAEQAQVVQRVVNATVADEAAYEAKNPDYYPALRFLEQQRHAFYEAQGIDDPQQRNNLILRDKFNISRQALDMGVSPAVFLHNYAKGQGFVAPASTIGANGGAAPANPAASATAAAPKPTPTVAQDPALAAAAKGQAQASASLSKAGSSPSISEEVTMENLAKLKGAEFDRAMAKFRKQQGLT